MPLKVVLVEDTLADAELAIALLCRRWPELSSERVETDAGFRRALAAAPDIVVADYEVPGFGALAALRILKELGSEVPLIVYTGAITPGIVDECTRLGAVACLLKDRWTELATVVGVALSGRERA